MEPREFHWPASAIFRLITADMNSVYEYAGEKMELPKHAKSLLEIGGGNGRVASEVIKLNPQLSNVVTTDIAKAMVDQAEKLIEKNNFGGIMSAEINDTHNLNYDDGSFDAVISFGSLHHFSDPVKVLHECNRVLKPNGYLGIMDICDKPTFDTVLKKIKELNGNRLMAISFWLGGMDTLPLSEIKDIVKKANIPHLSISYEKPFVMISRIKPKK